MSSLIYWFVALAALGCSTIAFPGEYVPKSFYILDNDGHKSNVVYLRKSFASRSRRSPAGGAYASSSSYGGSGGGAGVSFDGAGPGPGDIAAHVQAGLSNTFQQLRSLANEAGANGGGGYSGSFSSGGGPGAAGHSGTVLHSRFAGDASGSEKELVTGGDGRVHASSSANGPNGGFSFSSSSVDSNGNVRYNTQARKF